MKIAILLPSAALTWVSRARALARLLADAACASGREVALAIGVPQVDETKWRAIERAIRADVPAAIVRHLTWEPVLVDHARRMFASLDPGLDLARMEEVVVPRDWGWNFTDCDAWINLADPGLGPLLPLKPTVHICPDLAVRVVPSAYASDAVAPYWAKQVGAFRLWRQAKVLTSDPYTVEDLVSYAGVRRERVGMMPYLLDCEEIGADFKDKRPGKHLLWWMEPSSLHDLAAALEGWDTYSREGGSLELLLAGESLDGAARAEPAPQLLPAFLLSLWAGLPKVRISSEAMMTRLIGRAAVVWSSRTAGGEAEALRRAAVGRAHFLGANYPLHAAEHARIGSSALLYRYNDALAIADALHQAEELAVREPLPPAPAFEDRAYRLQTAGFMLDDLAELCRG